MTARNRKRAGRRRMSVIKVIDISIGKYHHRTIYLYRRKKWRRGVTWNRCDIGHRPCCQRYRIVTRNILHRISIITTCWVGI